MMTTVVWNTYGEIIGVFDSLDEAEEWIEDCKHTELTRTHNGGEINIAVLESH